MTKPITPSNVVGYKSRIIPSQVIEVFNELISQNWGVKSAIVKQNDAVEMIALALQIPKEQVFARHYLDIEPIFADAGWTVVYDKPGYNESYDATFNFYPKS